MGVLYMNGLGVAKDYSKAAECFRQSGEKGKPNAYTKLGSLYFSGDYGLDRDSIRAIELWQEAAKLKDVEGMFMLGLCYKDGIGVPKDLNKAYSYFYKCAKLGHVKSQYYVGKLLCDEEYPNRDYRQGKKWLKLAINQGDRRALEFYNVKFNYACPTRN